LGAAPALRPAWERRRSLARTLLDGDFRFSIFDFRFSIAAEQLRPQLGTETRKLLGNRKSKIQNPKSKMRHPTSCFPRVEAACVP
jgi:hypothetical protein